MRSFVSSEYLPSEDVSQNRGCGCVHPPATIAISRGRLRADFLTNELNLPRAKGDEFDNGRIGNGDAHDVALSADDLRASLLAFEFDLGLADLDNQIVHAVANPAILRGNSGCFGFRFFLTCDRTVLVERKAKQQQETQTINRRFVRARRAFFEFMAECRSSDDGCRKIIHLFGFDRQIR